MDLLAFILALHAEGKTAEEVRAAVDQYLEDNPEAIDQAAVEAILDGRLDDIEEDVSGLKSALTKTPRDYDSDSTADLDVTDGNGNVLMRMKDGNLQTKNFDSTLSAVTLSSTGDTTDRTAEILAQLTQAGVCRLGSGVFYTTGINMPDNSSLIGSGVATKLILSGTDDGYAVKLNKYNTVSGMTILGADANISLSSTVGARHGILWLGDYTSSRATLQQPQRGMLNDLYIERFSGGGITCRDTGYGTINHLYGVNINIRNCNAGINIDYWSEFHKFANVRTYGCYYGCINNGGNNNFTNCDFSDVKMGFVMDAALSPTGTAPNNSHGSAVGCTFNHMDSNTGIGIKLVDGISGFMFSGCQIFYAQTVLSGNNYGIVFSACNYGADNCGISISGGGAILFTGCMFQAAPTITVTDNEHVHFTDCYVRDTGAAVDAA